MLQKVLLSCMKKGLSRWWTICRLICCITYILVVVSVSLEFHITQCLKALGKDVVSGSLCGLQCWPISACSPASGSSYLPNIYEHSILKQPHVIMSSFIFHICMCLDLIKWVPLDMSYCVFLNMDWTIIGGVDILNVTLVHQISIEWDVSIFADISP